MPLTSARHVSGPTIPSTLRPSACWKPRTASSVFGPKIPSICRPWLGSPERLRKLELLLHAPHRVPAVVATHLRDQPRPGQRSDDSICGQPARCLHRLNRSFRERAEDSVHAHLLAVRAKQVLKRAHRMPIRTPTNQRPRLNRIGHRTMATRILRRRSLKCRPRTYGRALDVSLQILQGPPVQAGRWGDQ
jgi:hypothetical protein